MPAPRTLVVGCGSIGERHLRNLLALGVRELAVHDTDPQRLEAVRARYPVTAHATLEAALAAAPELALVCVPTHLHVPVATALARAGSHLFVEKPLAERPAGVEELIAAVEAAGRVALVGCNLRFHPAVERITRIVDGGTLGRVLAIRAHFGHYLPNWRPRQDYRTAYSARAAEGGGIILDAIHDIDYVARLGGDVTEVFCYAGKVSDLDVDVEDTADLLLRFKDGGVASIHLDYLDRVKRRSCEVVGSEGTVVWHSRRKEPEEIVVEHHRDNREAVVDRFEADPNAPYVAELRHLLACVAGAATPALGLREAWADVAIALAARESARCGRPQRVTGRPVAADRA